jgi:hypothetical protein
MTKPLDQLKALIALCGGVGNCAFLLGLSRNTIKDFIYKREQISIIGALLVSRSKYLRKFFNKKHLRPDCDAKDWSEYRHHSFYKSARKVQLDNESSPICDLMPPAILLGNKWRSLKK